MEDIIKIKKHGMDYEIVVASGVTGEDIEKGLAILIDSLVKREKEIDESFTAFRLLRGIEQWLEQLEELQ